VLYNGRTSSRVRRAVLVFAAVCCAGCSAGAPSTRLTILAVNPNVGRAVFHVACPGRGCAALAAEPNLVLRPKPFVCWGGSWSWWDLWITGRVGGRPVRTHVATCWTPQMRLIGKLGIARTLQAHLVPRRRRELVIGDRVTYPAGALRPGDLVVCHTYVKRLEADVPLVYELGGSGEGYGGTRIEFMLRVVRHPDGSVTASCV
jgi:hypothetical protein